MKMAATKAMLVITSYSIHYTKLYELLPTAEPIALTVREPTGARISVTATRIARTVLTVSLPGKTAIRPLRHVLSEAFDQTRSIGWISQLLTAAGQTAGHRLRGMDTSVITSYSIHYTKLYE